MNKKLVRASYESCLNSAARLSAYATSKPFIDALEVNERQDILAADDLVEFCIHARRLIESVGLKELTNSTTIIANNGQPMSLWKIIGYLIHHDDLEIIRSEVRLRMIRASKESRSKEEFWTKVGPELTKKSYSEPITPYILFKSDKIPYTPISLLEFMQVFSEQIFRAIVQKSLQLDLCLRDDPFEDLELSQEEVSSILYQSGIIR